MNKKIILITGSSRGIGYELTKSLIQLESFVVIFTTRNEFKGNLILNAFRKISPDVFHQILNVDDKESILSLVKRIVNQFGKLDILVNNAGVYLDSEDLDEFPNFLDITENILEKTLKTNLFGCMILCQLLMPHFNEKGLIINISSGDGKLNTSGDRSGHISYRVSKTALNSFSLSLSKQLDPDKIKILSICPGWVQTDMGGPNASRTIHEGVSDIIKVILNQENFSSGSFLYEFRKQKL